MARPPQLLIRLPSRGKVAEKALSKEKDPASQERLAEVRRELAALEDTLRPLIVRPLTPLPLCAPSLPGSREV